MDRSQPETETDRTRGAAIASRGPDKTLDGTPEAPARPADAPLGLRLVGGVIDVSLNAMGAVAGLVIALVNSDTDLLTSETPDVTLLDTNFVGYWFVSGVMLVQLVNWILISQTGQSIGKKLAGTQVVQVEDDEPPDIVRGVVLREILPGLLWVLPIAAILFWIVDRLWIYRPGRRCLHDLIAQTRVVRVA